MILGYYPTYPGDESAYDTKEFPNIYINDIITEL